MTIHKYCIHSLTLCLEKLLLPGDNNLCTMRSEDFQIPDNIF